MTEFLDYKVLLQLKDGTTTQGFVTLVNRSQISLGSRSIENSKVKDLKVVQLPGDKLKLRSKASLTQLDDAIVLVSGANSRSATPRLSKKHPDWGSDVQDIKSSEDFDFAANLAMFDKKSVFADFQKHDSVSAQDRLVSHNKVEKRVKNAQDKYDNDEMILSKNKQDNWNKLGSLSQRLSLPVSSGGLPSTGSKVSRDSQVYKFTFEDGSSPVPLASPVQLLEIERIAEESFGIDATISVEICASNLYNMIVSKILGGSVRLSNRKNHNLPPLVLLLIGSGHCSSKAFALGRHLSNHGVRVLAYVINEDIVEADTLRQCQLFEKCGGKVVSTGFPELVDFLNNQLDTPVELVIDSLQGFASQISDLFYTSESMDILREVVRWTNEPGQKFKVLSLDIASGIDGGSGTVSDQLLKINSKFIASLGLPVSGLLHAYNNGSLNDDVQHYVVDLGICNDVYTAKPHLRKFDKFWFCAEGFMKLELISE
ncbi:YjeF N-terminal domain-like protein [Metschnikowia bicuspidata var. bicuspidata NRRL YB-4993]|uniref:Enhancer of mRNA-decapping protein 3 n=1 Tax=Metschnikowia bicuspidata var. bicuspidata NRRL YB-4993 TaxID=869754 RepID=A0A1A0HG82_9ASCO|nr:YjeF N-terminal domain-like protein [Metschnikowia bicuspidata var. bicuspidata NRRL YB-4993]OBA22868.1 YjeF N-terminal domain-like protein [Metschnikowia bicuspidata var. bicuspidata NRRL YB-4993]